MRYLLFLPALIFFLLPMLNAAYKSRRNEQDKPQSEQAELPDVFVGYTITNDHKR